MRCTKKHAPWDTGGPLWGTPPAPGGCRSPRRGIGSRMCRTASRARGCPDADFHRTCGTSPSRPPSPRCPPRSWRRSRTPRPQPETSCRAYSGPARDRATRDCARRSRVFPFLDMSDCTVVKCRQRAFVSIKSSLQIFQGAQTADGAENDWKKPPGRRLREGCVTKKNPRRLFFPARLSLYRRAALLSPLPRTDRSSRAPRTPSARPARRFCSRRPPAIPERPNRGR